MVANLLNVTPSALHDWASERNTLPKEIFDKIKLMGYKSFIIEAKNDSWGKALGGKNSKGRLKTIDVPSKNGDLAELVGMILGDGNLGYFRKGKRVGTYALKIGVI